MLSIFRLHGNHKLEEKTWKISNLVVTKVEGCQPNQFEGVHMNDLPIVEDHISRSILLYEIDKVDRTVTGEIARIAQKYETAVRLLTYNERFCHMTYDVAMFTVFRCPSCDTFFNRASKIERHSTGCSKRVKHVYLRSVYQIRKTFFTSWTFWNRIDEQAHAFQKIAYLTLNLFVWKKIASVTQTQQNGLTKYSQFSHHFIKLGRSTNFHLQLWSLSSCCIF